MAVFKRYKGQKITSRHPRWRDASWWAEGQVNGIRYHQSLKKDGVSSKDEALNAESLLVMSIRQGSFDLMRDRSSFSDYADNEYVQIVQAKNVSARMKLIHIAKLKDFFGGYKLKAITSGVCEKYKNWRLAQKLSCARHKSSDCTDPRCLPRNNVSPSTVNRELACLSDIFSSAIRDRKLDTNPMKFVQKLDEPPPRDKQLDGDKRYALLHACADHPSLLPIVLMALLTGWRRGQILGIKVEDLDEKTQSVWIGRSKGQAPRKVPVNETAWKILSRQAELWRTGLLFRSSKTGDQITDFTKTWKAAVKKAGVPKLRFHDLRGVFATAMLEAKADSFTIQKALGHSSDSMTKRYAQVRDPLLLDGLKHVESTIVDIIPGGNNTTGSKSQPTISSPSEEV